MAKIEDVISYWKNGSLDDFEAAEKLLAAKKFHHALFFLHLCLEKILNLISRRVMMTINLISIKKRLWNTPRNGLKKENNCANFFLDTMNNDQTLVISKLRQFIKIIKNSGIPVAATYLFGSYASGASTAASDIDVCVVSPAFGKDYFDETVALRRLALKVDSRIEPLPLTEEDYQDPYSSVATQVRKKGVKII